QNQSINIAMSPVYASSESSGGVDEGRGGGGSTWEDPEAPGPHEASDCLAGRGGGGGG
nr:hypothetical protein [Tanacetum cinerariifolium]